MAGLAADWDGLTLGVAWQYPLDRPWFASWHGAGPRRSEAAVAVPLPLPDQIDPRRPRPVLRGVAMLSTVGAVLAIGTSVDYAQSLDQYFPTGLSGFNESFTTVTTRARGEYDPLPVHAGAFDLLPELSQSLGYDSNPAASGRPRGAGVSDTEASVTVNSDWSRNAVGLFAAVDSQNYLGLSQQSHTDVRVVGTGRLDFGTDHANVSASYLDLHETADQLNALATQQPLHYAVTDLRASYLAKFGDLSLLPTLEATAYRFDNALIGGVDSNQGFRSRDVVQGGVTASYAFAPGQSGVLAVNLVRVDYTDNPLAQPSRDSTGGSVLAGIDYSENDIFRYRLLGGIETRLFDSPVYKTHTAPIVQGDLVWTITTLTTLTGRVARAIEDAADESQIGYTDTQAQLTLDHEYARDLLLQGRIGVDRADYLQGGTVATLYTAGVTATYLVNRTVRVSLSTDVQARRSNIGNDFVRDITLVRVQAQL